MRLDQFLVFVCGLSLFVIFCPIDPFLAPTDPHHAMRVMIPKFSHLENPFETLN